MEFLLLLGKKNEVFQEAQLLRNCAERLYLALKVPDAFVLPVEKIAPVIAHPRLLLSVCSEHASASEAGSDRSNRGQAAQNAGGGDGTDCGVTLGAPGRAEPIGHLAEDHRWPQTLLGHIVGRRHVTAGDEDEQLVPAFLDAAPELEACLRIGLNRQQANEAAIQVCAGRPEACCPPGFLAPSADDERPPQEKLEARRKQFIPGVNCVSGVAQQMGKAHLMRLCVVHLRAQPVADPDFRRRAFEKPGHHRRAAAGRDAVRHRRGRAEHPLPAGLPLDTRRCLLQYFVNAS